MLDLVAPLLAIKAADFLNVIGVDEFPGGLAVDHLSCPPSAKPPPHYEGTLCKEKALAYQRSRFLAKVLSSARTRTIRRRSWPVDHRLAQAKFAGALYRRQGRF